MAVTDPSSDVSAPTSPTESFLRVALAAAEALGRLHQRGIVHQDVHPGTLRFGPHDAVELVVPDAPRPAEPPSAIRVTSLAYMAPEQTGRLEGPVDHRADLYSLGVVLYERLSGTLPIHAEDGDWHHAHLARSPRPLLEVKPDAPSILSDILMKLLAKSPDERYQSAKGLRFDLERCLDEITEKGFISAFPLGTRDIWDKLHATPRMYGRQAELAKLELALARASTDYGVEMLLVTGPSGIGKTALASELQKQTSERALFVSVKFEAHKRDVPYGAIGPAFIDLAQKLFSLPDAELQAARARLASSLGASAPVLVELFPELELVLGPTPKPALQTSADAHERAKTAFCRLCAVLGTPERPLVLFLDDMQWADLGSLDLVQQLVTQPSLRSLLVLGAYRDDEADAAHPLTVMRRAIERAGAKVSVLPIGPLAQAHLIDLVADLFRCDRAEAEPLAALVWAKTRGNPFFVEQLLTVLHEDNLIHFDTRRWAWRWDLEAIEAKEITDDLVALVLEKLQRLPRQTLEVLEIAASNGNEFTVELLATLCSKTPAEIREDLAPAIAEGILLGRPQGYKFLHDKLVLAAYSLIPEEERTVLHFRLGWLLLERTPEEELDSVIFEAANQLNKGAAHVEAPEDRRRIAELDLRAGRKAKAAAAAKIAAMYLATGISLLPWDGWGADYALAYELHLELAECELLAGRFEEAERICGVLLQNARTKVAKADAYRIKLRLATTQQANAKAVAEGLKCLDMLGVDVPPSPSSAMVQAQIQWVRDKLDERSTDELVCLPEMNDREMIAAMEILSELFPAATFVSQNLSQLVIAKMVRLSLEYGNTPASVYGYVTLGTVLCTEFDAFAAGYRLGDVACRLGARRGFDRYRVEAMIHFGSLILPLVRPGREALDTLRASFHVAREAGKILFACGSLVQLAAMLLSVGEPLEAVYEASLSAFEFAMSAKIGMMVDIAVSLQRLVRALRGSAGQAVFWGADTIDEATFEAHLRDRSAPHFYKWYLVHKLQAHYLLEDPLGALAAAEGAREPVMHVLLEAEYVFYAALAVAAAYEGASAEEQARLGAELARGEARFGRWAAGCPAHFLGKHALLRAERARVEGRELDAMRFYEEAIRESRQRELQQDEAIACELAGRFFHGRGFAIPAAAYLQRARMLYERWGADKKVERLDAKFGELFAEARKEAALKDGALRPADTLAMDKIARALAGATTPEGWLGELFRVLIEVAGAQRCALLLPFADKLEVAAEAITEQEGVKVSILGRGAMSPVDTLPLSIVHSARRTRERLVLDDVTGMAMFPTDPYLLRVLPRSLYCAPIIRRGEVAGVLYMENRLVRGAFATSRFGMLEFLAVVSLENALLIGER